MIDHYSLTFRDFINREAAVLLAWMCGFCMPFVLFTLVLYGFV